MACVSENCATHPPVLDALCPSPAECPIAKPLPESSPATHLPRQDFPPLCFSSRSASAELVKRMRDIRQQPCEPAVTGGLVASGRQNQFPLHGHFLHRSNHGQYPGAGCRVSPF